MQSGDHVDIGGLPDGLQEHDTLCTVIVDQTLFRHQSKVKDKSEAEFKDIVPHPYRGADLYGRVKTRDREFQNPP